jgi:hypothetical protein
MENAQERKTGDCFPQRRDRSDGGGKTPGAGTGRQGDVFQQVAGAEQVVVPQRLANRGGERGGFCVDFAWQTAA